MTNDLLPEVRLWIAVLEQAQRTLPAPSEDRVEARRWLSVLTAISNWLAELRPPDVRTACSRRRHTLLAIGH
jgi:hypothetical protein